MTFRSWLCLFVLPLSGLSCGKVPLHDVDAGFVVADASWFEAEQTLFFFTEVTAEQGIGDLSLIEVTYTTPSSVVDWTPMRDLTMVHTHLDVDCGIDRLCGSASVKVPLQPRNVGIRLRYHPEGSLALSSNTVFNAVGLGPDYTNRSLLVYGVFDATNTMIQWRARHQFPTIRNERATELGLRRAFVIRDQVFGDNELVTRRNPYGYGVECPGSFEAIDHPPVATTDRAKFDDVEVPVAAFDAPTVCAQATVEDALGSYTTGAVARKNPEVKPAFPLLRSPVREARMLPFFLGPCERTISADHEAMLRQRLQLGLLPTTCIDDWEQPDFVANLIVLFREAIEAARPRGDDMVLVIAVNQDDEGVSDAVEEALAKVVPRERERSSPRVAGAFVLDSTDRGLNVPSNKPVTLWCPSTIPFDEIPDVSARSCPVLPDVLNLDLGPFSIGTLPILPTRDQYLDFIDTYSKAQAGSVESLRFLTPEFSATADFRPLGDFGVATFLNNEVITADPDDAFSFCTPDEPLPFVFSSDILTALGQKGISPQDCEYLGLDPDACGAVGAGLLPIENLPEWHDLVGESIYDLGVFWEFPFLLRMDYEVVLAGSASAFGVSVPFGVASPAEAFYGTELWMTDKLPLAEALTQCTRFCDHGTFDSAGVYHPSDGFTPTYGSTCYRPRYPELGDDGFPVDP
jgi:hypothetical protein